MKPQLLFQRFLLSLTFVTATSLVIAQTPVRCYTDEMELERRLNDPAAESPESFEQWMSERVQFNQSSEEFIVYPNPTNGMLTLETSNTGNQSVRIIDASGRILLERAILGSHDSFDLSAFADVMYTLVLSSDSGLRMVNCRKQINEPQC